MKYIYKLIIYIFFVSISSNGLSANLYKINAIIKDSTSNERLPFATVKAIAEKSKVQFLTSDENGFVQFILPQGKYSLEISYLGYRNKYICFTVNNADIELGTIAMQQDTFKIKDIVITERKRLIKLTNSGIEYDISKDPSVQSTSLLYALRNAPLVNVDANGQVSVKGSNDYSIYLNGKPYRIAQANPKEVLQSIPASTISKIEIITNPDAKYDAEAGNTIINIITSNTFLDGYSMTINGASESKPKSNAGISFIGGKHNVTLSIGYNYSIDVQNKQPIDNYQNYYDSGVLMQSVKMNGVGDGQWKTHTMRAMLNWEVNNLNSIYIDGHGLLKSTDHTTEWFETIMKSGTDEKYCLFNTQDECRSGTAETNVIYRNLYKTSKNERFTLGYRYTYNPDKRNYISSETTYDDIIKWNKQPNPDSLNHNRNNGGLSEHTILSDILFEINKKNLLRVGLRQIFRAGSSKPEYNEWSFPLDSWIKPIGQEEKMHYNQNISGAYASYTTSFKQISLNVGIRSEYSWMTMKFPDAPNYNFSSNQFNLISRGSLSYQFTNQSQLKISYSEQVSRPTITMLSPFTNKSSGYSISYGNPFLKDACTHNLSLSYMSFSNKLTLFGSLDYTRTNDAILGYYKKMNNSNITAYTYDNIGKITKAGGNLYINYYPIKSLSLTASYNVAYYGINSKEDKLRQNSLIYNLMLMYSLNFNHRWTIGGNYGLFRQIPQPWGHYNTFSIYSIYINKGLIDGKLNIGITVNSPFNKYSKLVSNIERYNLSQRYINYMTARSIGINISYTLQSKKKIKINREKTLQSDDLETGVK